MLRAATCRALGALLLWLGASSLVQASEALRQRLDELRLAPAHSTPFSFWDPRVVLELYQARGFELLWDAPRAERLVAAVMDAPAHGLRSEDYLGSKLEAMSALATLTGIERVDTDLMLTEAFLRYVYHRRDGKVLPHTLEPSWDYGRDVSGTQPMEMLDAVLAANDFAQALEQTLDQGPFYEALRHVLALYRSVASEHGWPSVAAGPTLRPGDVGARVESLRKRLGVADPPGMNPGFFDDSLALAVSEFQARHGLAVDGAVGPLTLEALNVSALQRLAQVRVNLERLRWVGTGDMPRFVAVNVAGFRVYYVERDRVVWSARAIVGRPYRPTPSFRADITHVVFNPTWTVPPTILRQDVLPAIVRDPRYLDAHQMELLDPSGRIIDRATVQWNRYPKEPFPFLVRQRAGPWNMLGQVKFVFPNEHFVYLHDTPSRELFERSDRTFSSGCIRIDRPLELAAIVLRDTEWDEATITAAIEHGASRTAFLRDPLPILVLYLTAIAFEEGSDHVFYRDVYQRDARVLTALDATKAEEAISASVRPSSPPSEADSEEAAADVACGAP